MARNDQRLPDYQDPRGGNVVSDMTLPGQKRPRDTKVPGVKRVGSSFSAASKLTQGGEGGGNVNIGNASGQSGQENIVGPTVQSGGPARQLGQSVAGLVKTAGGVAQQAGSTIMEKGLLPTIGAGLKTIGSMEAQGAQEFATKRLAPVGKFLFGPSTPSAVETPEVPTTTSISTPTPTVSEDTSKLGTFTTPTGGMATITKSGGASAFTPSQQSSLQTILNREADPAFQARLAEQANIVNERIARRKLGEAAEAEGSTQAGLIAERKRLAGGNVGAQISGIDRQLGEIGEISKSNIAAESAERRASISDVAAQGTAQAKRLSDIGTARAAGLSAAINDINAAKSSGMPDSLPTFGQSLATARASGAPLDRTSLDTILSHQGLTNEFNQIPDRLKSDWLLKHGVQQQHIDEILG